MYAVTDKELAMMKTIVLHNEHGERGCLDNTPWSWAVCKAKSWGAVLGSLVAKGLAHQSGRGNDASCGLTTAGKRAYLEIVGRDGVWSNEPELDCAVHGHVT